MSAAPVGGGEQAPDLMAALRASIVAAKIRRLQQEALTARAVGDYEAERAALDAIIVVERTEATR